MKESSLTSLPRQQRETVFAEDSARRDATTAARAHLVKVKLFAVNVPILIIINPRRNLI